MNVAGHRRLSGIAIVSALALCPVAGFGEMELATVSEGRIKCLSEERWQCVEHAIREGSRIGVDIGLFACPGSWNMACGPWVKPEQSMRYMALDEVRVMTAGGAGALGQAEADKPFLAIHLAPADTANGTAVVICPGGGYGGVMLSYEGHEIARWLNRLGVAGIVLKYRVHPYRHPAPLEDAQRAMRLVRSRAKDWGLDPQRIGMMGFSAGGHLASTVGTHFDDGDPQAPEALGRVSCRPDFLMLIYPVITMGPQGHNGSRNNLLGPTPAPELLELLSNEKQVTARTPPTFLAHSKMDRSVPATNSALFAAACRAKQVPVEYVELETGAHGLGCGKGPEWEAWQAKCVEWLKARKLISSTAGDK